MKNNNYSQDRHSRPTSRITSPTSTDSSYRRNSQSQRSSRAQQDESIRRTNQSKRKYPVDSTRSRVYASPKSAAHARAQYRGNSHLMLNIAIAILCIIIVVVFVVVLVTRTGQSSVSQSSSTAVVFQASESDGVVATSTAEIIEEETDVSDEISLLGTLTEADDIFTLTENNIATTNAILVDVNNRTILAERDSDEQIYPASMTKVMTILVAAENIEDFTDTFTMTADIINPLIEAEASRVGFEDGETITITDLLYGAALPSGADATAAIAEYVSDSEEAFVELMNEKAEELGMNNTHFVTTSGLHDEDHYSTVSDIAILMYAAMQNDICSEVLSTYQYTTTKTTQHPDGIALESTMFSHMYGTEVTGLTIEAGKTGYTDEAGNCLVSYATDDNGGIYICVIAKSTTYKQAIYDTFAIYGIIDGGYTMPTDLAIEEVAVDTSNSTDDTSTDTSESTTTAYSVY